MSKQKISDIELLFIYARNHEWDKFKKIVELNKTIDLNFRYNNTYLLTYAVNFNKIDIVRFLFEHNVKYDITDTKGRSILYVAIKNNFTEIINIILEYSQKLIGLNITNIRDYQNNIPLHYAITYSDFETTKKLISLNSNILLYDIKGNNGLHIAIKSGNTNITKYIINNISNINKKTLSGETALHIAINYGYNEIVSLLLKNDADPNISDDTNDFSPLHYAVGWNNTYVIKELLNYKASSNIQDMYGNIPIIYSIKEKYIESFNILINTDINVNQWNVDGKTVLHEILDKYTPSEKHFLDNVLPLSNLLIQDRNGISCLYYLVIYNIWKDYIDILKLKKLNIFAKTFTGDTIINYIYPSDKYDVTKIQEYNLFLDVITQSYMHQLKKERNWKHELDKICSRELSELTNEEKIKIGNVQNKKMMLTECFNIIRNKIINNIEDFRKNKYTFCSFSYPIKDIKCNVQLSEYKLLDVCTFTGSLLDVLFGMLYIIKKHKNVCSSLDINQSYNEDLCNFYKSSGLIMNGRCEFLNFEIVWVEFKLYIIPNYDKIFNKCVKSKTRFIVIPLGIELKSGSHSNYLIYDKTTNEIERFEPHGGTTPIGFNYNSHLLDESLIKYFKTINNNIKYIRPEDYIPKIGFQIMDSYETNNKRIGDPGGFCALWSIWYVDQRLTYQELDRKTLINELFKHISISGISYKNMIRNYARDILIQRDQLLNQINLNVNDWLNNNYTNIQLDKLRTLLIENIKKNS
jgi:ankyrin repeat protein